MRRYPSLWRITFCQRECYIHIGVGSCVARSTTMGDFARASARGTGDDGSRFLLPDMDTLDNVASRNNGDTAMTSRGFAPDAISEKERFYDGVSVGYAHEENKRWYVLRPTYGRAMTALATMTFRGIDAYLPMKRMRVVREDSENTSVSYESKPLLKSIIFARTTHDNVRMMTKGPGRIECLTPYYDHFRKNAYGRNDYLTVRDDQMANFMKVIDADNENIVLADPKNTKLTNGQAVRVIGGKFAGITGRVARYKGQQRVFVELDNVCIVGTAYIPSYLLEIV